MKKYAITNCQFCLKDEWEGFTTYLCKESMNKCAECSCLLKKIVDDVSTVYKTPEYFEELEKTGDEDQYCIESAWHNVAHMVMSKVNIEEIKE
jgi:hypothetical protein